MLPDLFGSYNAANRLSAGASPQTPLGELIALPRPSSCIYGLLLKGDGRGKRGEGTEGRGRSSSFALGRKKKSRRVWAQMTLGNHSEFRICLSCCRKVILFVTVAYNHSHNVYTVYTLLGLQTLLRKWFNFWPFTTH